MQFPNITPPDLAYFDPGDGRRIAYRYRPPATGKPTVLFLPGYASDMEGDEGGRDRCLLRAAGHWVPSARLFGNGFERRKLSPMAPFHVGFRR